MDHMTDRSKICAIAVMAKAPQAGRSKTRLVPALSPEQAAAMSAAFLHDITENVAAAGRIEAIDGYIAYAPAGLEGLFDGHLAPGTGLVLADGAPAVPEGVAGFGRCLLHAIETLLAAGYGAAIVLNSDSPTLPTAFLAQAAAALAAPGERAVMGPAEDGGYYLLGVKSAQAHLFKDIPWSTADVAAHTRERAAEIGLTLTELPAWYDVDDESALNVLIAHISAPPVQGHPPYPAPVTAALLRRLGRLAPDLRKSA